ncbi:MAG: PKD domain-containing protein [Bacteroidia bacterium]
MKNIYKLIFTISALTLIFNISMAQTLLHDNGPLVNSPGAGFGGADVSNLHDGLLNYGFGHAVSTGFRVADDFTVPAPGWVVDSIVFFGYQTGTTTTSSITNVNMAIWDGLPGSGASIIYGDTTTNVLATSYWSGIYRTTEIDLVNTQRPIMKDIVNTPALTLAAGTYYVSWQTGGSATFTGPWVPPVTIAGVTTTGDGYQFNPANGTWAAVVDVGPQGFPFMIYGHVQSSGGGPCDTTVAFTGLSVAIPDGDTLGIDDVQAVAGVTGTTLGTDVFLQSVCLTITHTWVGDLRIILTAPNGAQVELMDQPGVPASTFGCDGDNLDFCVALGTGNDVENVCNNLPAISGTYTAANGVDLNSINTAGGSPNGNWTLTMKDYATPDAGTLTEWALTFSSSATVPSASFTSIANFLVVDFTNTSTNATTYFWDFGDGGTSSATNPSHTYATGGTYTVCLVATSGACSDSICQSVTVSGCTEGVVDGGMEAGSPSAAWTEASTNFGTPLCTVAGCGVGGGSGPHTGTWWSWFGGIALFEEGEQSQSVTIPTNNTANLYFWLEVPVACDGPTDFMKVAMDADTVFAVDGTSALCGVVGYTLQTVNLDVYADGNPHTLDFFSRIYAVNGTGTNFFVDDISIIICPIVGITEQAIAQNISLLPNPASFAINLSLSGIEKNVSVKINNMQGQTMYVKSIGNTAGSYSETIDVSKWSKGVYMVTISNENKSIVRKIVIQ